MSPEFAWTVNDSASSSGDTLGSSSGTAGAGASLCPSDPFPPFFAADARLFDWAGGDSGFDPQHPMAGGRSSYPPSSLTKPASPAQRLRPPVAGAVTGAPSTRSSVASRVLMSEGAREKGLRELPLGHQVRRPGIGARRSHLTALPTVNSRGVTGSKRAVQNGRARASREGLRGGSPA